MAEEKKKKNEKEIEGGKVTSRAESIISPEILDKLKAAVFSRKNALFPRAHEILINILKEHPVFVPAQKELFALYITTENYDEAEVFLIELEKKFKDKEWILLSLMETYRKKNDTQKQIEIVKRYIEISYDEKLLRRLFDLQKNAGDMEGALQTILTRRSKNDTVELEAAQGQLTAL